MSVRAYLDFDDILAEYMKSTAGATVSLANSLSQLEDPQTLSETELALTSAVLWGSQQPSVADLGEVFQMKRKKIDSSHMRDNILHKISTAMPGIELDRRRNELWIGQLQNLVTTMTLPGNFDLFCEKPRNDPVRNPFVNIGLSDTGTAVFDPKEFKVRPPTATIAAASESDNFKEEVKAWFDKLFDGSKVADGDFEWAYTLAHGKLASVFSSWMKNVIETVSLGERSASPNASAQQRQRATEAVRNIVRNTRGNYNHDVFKLSRLDDVKKMQEYLETIKNYILDYSIETLLTVIFFYTCFDVVSSPAERMMVETGQSNVVYIKPRSHKQIVFTIVCLAVSWPTSLADLMLEPWTSRRLTVYRMLKRRNLGSEYSNAWDIFETALANRSNVFCQGKISELNLEHHLNLYGPVYVVVSNGVTALTLLKSCHNSILLEFANLVSIANAQSDTP